MGDVISNASYVLRKLSDQYYGDGGKGLIHGFQKDLIQNSVGAREYDSFKNWEIKIELMKINGRYCVVATDKGTNGLSGGAYSDNEFLSKTRSSGDWSDGNIPSNQRLMRFLHSDFSGGGIGPGSKGQGKGLYHVLSSKENKSTFIFESVQNNNGDQGSYLCGKKYVDSVKMKYDFQFPDNPLDLSPLKNKYIESFKSWTNNELNPLNHVGTRIIIYGLDENVTYDENDGLTFIQVFRNSFDKGLDDLHSKKSLYNMIQETWWELIVKKPNAKIIIAEGGEERVLKYDGNIKRLMPSLDLNPRVNEHEGKACKIRVVRNLNLNYGGLKIKKLTLIRFNRPIEGLDQGIYINRRMMKVGNSVPVGRFSGLLHDSFYGYVELEKNTEDELAKYENGIHYSFQKDKGFMKNHFNKTLVQEYTKFLQFCGLSERSSRTQGSAFRDAYLQIVNRLDFANVSDWAPQNKEPDFKITIESLEKSSDDWGMEYTDTIGPIKVRIFNNESYNLEGGRFILEFMQDSSPERICVFEKDIDIIEAGGSVVVGVDRFGLIDRGLNYRQKINLKFRLLDKNLEEKGPGNSRWIWLGLPEPDVINKKNVNIGAVSASFPLPNTKRVEIGDNIEDVGCKITSNMSKSMECLVVGKITYNQNGRQDLFTFYKEVINLSSGEEKWVDFPDLNINNEFDIIASREEKEKEREVKISVQVFSNRDDKDSGVQKGLLLSNRRDLVFYIEYSPKGKGPFTDEGSCNDPKQSKSYFEPEVSGGGYRFILNYAHRCWKELETYKEKGLLEKQYRLTEIAKQAVLLAIENNKTDHRFFKRLTNLGTQTYKDVFDGELSAGESLRYIDELVEKILG